MTVTARPAAGADDLVEAATTYCLASMVPERGQRRAALAVLAVAVAAFLAAAPFAQVQWPQVWAFLPIYQSAYMMIALVTAVLLVSQFRLVRSRAVLLLAGAYLFDALMALAHALSFPGLFAPGGLLGAGPQTTAWLYFLWHGGFPLGVMGYALLRGGARDLLPEAGSDRAWIGATCLAAIALAGGLTLLATAGHDLMPVIMTGNLDASTKIVVATITWLISLAALAALWPRRWDSLLDLWLVVTVCIWIFDSALAAVLNHGRFDVGWYMGRAEGLLAGSLVFVMLLLENGALYARLARLRVVERQESSARLEASEERFRRLFEAAPVALGLIGHDGRSIAQNRNFDRLFGYTLADLPTLDDWWRLAYPDPAYRAEVIARWDAAVRAAGNADGPIDAGEYRISCKDGASRIVDITGIVVPEGILTSFVDVTERRRSERVREADHAVALKAQQQARLAVLNQMEDANAARQEILELNAGLEHRVAERTAELTAANQEIDAFAYAVSHDLRAPLRAMSGFSQALVEDYGGQLPGEAQAYIDQIGIASRRMGELIDGILALSRSTRGELRRDSLDMSALARRHLEELARTEPARQVAVSVEPGLQARGDARMIDAVLGNLLGNAWKYTARTAAPEIRVHRGEVAGHQGFCITDNGAGFDPAHAGRLFKPFQRLHRQDEFPGIGIGLATVQRIVHRHGGEIVATGEPGQGASFCFTLPEYSAQETSS